MDRHFARPFLEVAKFELNGFCQARPNDVTVLGRYSHESSQFALMGKLVFGDMTFVISSCGEDGNSSL